VVESATSSTLLAAEEPETQDTLAVATIVHQYVPAAVKVLLLLDSILAAAAAAEQQYQLPKLAVLVVAEYLAVELGKLILVVAVLAVVLAVLVALVVLEF
jgi:hypothetical protein